MKVFPISPVLSNRACFFLISQSFFGVACTEFASTKVSFPFNYSDMLVICGPSKHDQPGCGTSGHVYTAWSTPQVLSDMAPNVILEVLCGGMCLKPTRRMMLMYMSPCNSNIQPHSNPCSDPNKLNEIENDIIISIRHIFKFSGTSTVSSLFCRDVCFGLCIQMSFLKQFQLILKVNYN